MDGQRRARAQVCRGRERPLVLEVVRDLDELEGQAVRVAEVDPAPAGEGTGVDDVDVGVERDALALELGLGRARRRRP